MRTSVFQLLSHKILGLLIFIPFLVIVVYPLHGQKKTVLEYKLKGIPVWKPSEHKTLPGKISLKEYTPPVGNQKDKKNCVAWALGYGAMTIQYAKKNALKSSQIQGTIFSSAFIDYQLKKTVNTRENMLIDAIQVIKEQGNIFQTPRDRAKSSTKRNFTAKEIEEAKTHRIDDFTLLFKKSSEESLKLSNTKKALAMGHPVVVSMTIRKNFHSLKRAKFWLPNTGNKTYAGGHALVVVGYDDSINAFQLMNSYGEDWGDGGFIWLKYEDYISVVKSAFCLADVQVKKPKKALMASINLNKKRTKSNNQSSYKIQLMAIEKYNKEDTRLQKVKHLGTIETELVAHQTKMLTRIQLTVVYSKKEVIDLLRKIRNCGFPDAFLVS